MNKVKSECVHSKRGGWELKDKLAYTTEELDIIIKAAVAAKESNKHYYERFAEKERVEAEKRKDKVKLKDRLMNSLFCEEE